MISDDILSEFLAFCKILIFIVILLITAAFFLKRYNTNCLIRQNSLKVVNRLLLIMLKELKILLKLY